MSRCGCCACTLAGYARHPNFSHVIVLGLGCEVNQIGGLMEEQRLAGRLKAMDIQTMGGSRKTVAAGVAFVKDVLAESNQVTRVAVPAAELTVALQCGGSDGYSGVSANPALGAASDLLVRHGGTVILSETPETYGAEHLLTRRAVSQEVGEKLVGLMRWWEDYTRQEGAEMNANPSPGNKAGGLTTILEKSLGAMAEGWQHQLLVDVDALLRRKLKAQGFVFMDTPGADPVAATGPGRRRGQSGVLHHRPRQRVRLQAGTVDQAGDQHADVQAYRGRYGCELRHRPGRRRNGAAGRAADFRADPARRLRRADKVGAVRLRRGRIRPVGARGDDVEGCWGALTGEVLHVRTGLFVSGNDGVLFQDLFLIRYILTNSLITFRRAGVEPAPSDV